MLYRIVTSLTRAHKRAILLAIDIGWIAIAYLLARALLLGPDSVASGAPWTQAVELSVLAVLGAALIVAIGLHRIKLNAYQMQGVAESAALAAALACAGIAGSALIPAATTPAQVFVVFGMLFLILSVAGRLAMRQALLWIYRNARQPMRVLIYGAGQTGQQLAAALLTDAQVRPVGFVDDNPTLQSLTVCGLKVHSPNRLRHLVTDLAVDRIVLAMPSVSPPVQKRLRARLSDLDCKVHVLPSFAAIVADSLRAQETARKIDIDGLLGRNRLEEELPGVSGCYTGRSILVTGAGGSIGSEICRQLLACNPRRLVLLDHSELSLYRIERELRDIGSKVELAAVLGSVCHDDLVRDVIARHGVNVILHAAAYKQVPTVEVNRIEGVRNNVLGTRIVAHAARDAGVGHFILISSDKAVRPSSTMGASKRLAELIVQDLAMRATGTCFSMVRFGNVLGSSGSVVPLFEEQIRRGGPVTLTHSDVTRYFMTIAEAVRLVLLTGSFARGGDVFVLDMGKPVPIRKIARQMIEGAGYTVRDADNPDGDIEIKVTGLRPGEKLHEELLISTDMLTTPHPKILRAQENHLSELEMSKAMKDLNAAMSQRDPEIVRDVLRVWIDRADAPAPRRRPAIRAGEGTATQGDRLSL